MKSISPTMLFNKKLDDSVTFDLPGVTPGSDIETLFKTVGFVVVQWGVAEQSLDLMVASIFHSFAGDTLLQRRPANLEKKVKFLRECIAKYPELEQFKAESDALLTRFSVAGKKRNYVVHGAIADFSAEGGAFMFSKIDVVPKQHHSIRSVVLDGSDWTEFRRELLGLSREGQTLAKNVWDSLKARA